MNTTTVSLAVEGERRLPMSYDEYTAWDSDHAHTEWVNGEAVLLMSPTIPHQKVVNFLETLPTVFVNFFRLGEVLAAPSEMRILPDGNAREPDILYVETANLARLSNRRLDGPADLVVEVVSDESVARDRTEKFYEYQEGGVREYWIIDPRTRKGRADFWILAEDGLYRPVPLQRGGIYRSTVIPGFWMRAAWALSDDRPDPLLAFAEITGLPEEVVAALRRLAAEGPQTE